MNIGLYGAIALTLVQQAAVLALGSLGYCQIRNWIAQSMRGEHVAIAAGLLFGVLGIACLLQPVDAGGGVRLDLRNAAVAIATVFAGIGPGAIAAAAISLARLTVGGDGALPGIVSLAATLGISAGFMQLLRRGQKPVAPRALGWLGIALALSGLVVVALIPRPDTAAFVLVSVAPIWLILMPLTIVFVGAIVLHHEHGQKLGNALQQRQAELTAIMDHAPIAIFLKDTNSRYRLVNRRFEEWRGSAESAIGLTDAEIFPPAAAHVNIGSDVDVLKHGRIVQIERPLSAARFGVEHVLVTKFPIKDRDGAIAGIAGFSVDITARIKAEAALRESRELLIESQRVGKVGYVVSDSASQTVRWSDSLFDIRHVERRECFSPAEDRQYIHPEDLPSFTQALAAAAAERRDFEIDLRARRGDGSWGWEHIVGHPRFGADGTPSGFLLVLCDITQRRRAADALRRREERFRVLIEHSNDIIAVIATDGTMLYRSPSAFSLFGYDEGEVMGRTLLERIHPDDRADIAAKLERAAQSPGICSQGRSRVGHKDGSWRHVDWTARVATDVPEIGGIIINARDVTACRDLQEQLLQARKMEAIGRLAGGIAHDFNNINGAILGFASFLEQDLPPDSPEHRFATRIVHASRRAKDLVQQILAFSRRSGLERRPCDLAAVVAECESLLRAAIPRSIDFDLTIARESLVAEVNPGQIVQLLLNLCVNARDALPGNQGRVALRLDSASPSDWDFAYFAGGPHALEDGEVARAGSVDSARRYARISVADSGAGMSADVLKRIFEPFYTTKAPGHGSGIGLSVVYGVVTAHEGACLVASQAGRGTVFSIFIPLSAQRQERAPVAIASAPARGSERILVVEDESDALAAGLSGLGYEAVAADAAQAVELYRADPTRWDAVICDHTPATAGGLALLERLRAIRQPLRFILCTAVHTDATEEMAQAAGVTAVCIKPVLPEQVAIHIRRLVDMAAGEA